jgi:hypothetical protein
MVFVITHFLFIPQNHLLSFKKKKKNKDCHFGKNKPGGFQIKKNQAAILEKIRSLIISHFTQK